MIQNEVSFGSYSQPAAVEVILSILGIVVCIGGGKAGEDVIHFPQVGQWWRDTRKIAIRQPSSVDVSEFEVAR